MIGHYIFEATLFLLLALTFFGGIRRRKAAESETADWKRRATEALSEAQGFRDLLAERTQMLQDTTARLEGSLSANGAFQTSRDQVWGLYRKSVIGSGHAQAWLSRELNNAYQLLNTYRRKAGESEVQTPAGLVDLLEEFKSEHTENEVIP